MTSKSSSIARYAPLVAWLGVIAYGSGDDVSSDTTTSLLEKMLRVIVPNVSFEVVEDLNHLMRKAGHFTVYGVLALLAWRAFAGSRRASLERRAYLCALGLVATTALLDEYRQSFSAHRTGSFYDCLIDLAGGLTALAIVAAIKRIRVAR